MIENLEHHPGKPEIEAMYRPVPFWSWNDRLDTEELIRQIHLMHEAGIGGFFMHARGGLKTVYMSPEWMNAVTVCVREAVKLEMRPWLYDENGWPSGFGNGEVNALGESYQSKHAELLPAAEITDPGRVEAWYDADGRLLAGPEGAALALQVMVNPFYVDNLNPAVTDEFIRRSYARYWEELPADVREGLAGIFTDEPQLNTAGIPWSPVLTEEFRRRTGKELTAVFPELVRETGNWRQTRTEFWQTVAVLFRENYIKRIGNWCREHCWELTGHHLMEESYDSQLNMNGAVMPQYEGYTIPGIDHLYRYSSFTTSDIQVTSAAAQNGQKQILVETFACSGWNFNMKGMKWLYQQHLVHGINLLCQHLAAYSLHGQRKRDYPGSWSYQHPMWPHIKLLNDAFARVGRMLALGEVECEVLMLHGESSAWMRSHGHFEDRLSKELFQSFCHLTHVLLAAGIPCHYGDETMMAEQGAVSAGKLRLGKMSYSTVVIPPVENILPSTMKLLQEFARQGGRIVKVVSPGTAIFCIGGAVPTPSEQAFWEQLPVCSAENNLPEFLKNVPALAITLPGGTPGRVRGTWRRFADRNERWYYLADFAFTPENRVPEPDFLTEIYTNTPEAESGSLLEITLPFPAAKAEIIDQVSGEVLEEPALFTRPDGKTMFLKELPAAGSLLIRAADLPSAPPAADITGNWQCRTGDNVMTLEKVSCELSGETEWQPETDALALFNRLLALGEDKDLQIRYAFELRPDFNPQTADLKIAVERDREARYFLNDLEVPAEFLPGYFLDRSIRILQLPADRLRTGNNYFEVRTRFHQSQAVRESAAKAKYFESEANKLYFDSEVEAVYLLGQFGCYSSGTVRKEKENSFYPGAPFALGALPETVDSGRTVLQGFPFFTGVLTLTKDLELSAAQAAGFRKLRWSRLKANAVQFTVNGREFPLIFAPPYELDITGCLKPGKNRIELRIETSCRNTFGPFHTPETEPKSTSPAAFNTEPDILGRYLPGSVPDYGVLEPSPEEIKLF